MKINDQQVEGLLEMLALTKDVETNCDHCLNHMAEFAESKLSGKTIQEGLRNIEEHLERCGDCREEFETLKNALEDESF